MCCAWRSITYGKFTVKPDCVMLIMKQFGKPRMCRPWNVRTPSAHFSREREAVAPDDPVARTVRVVGADLEARGEDQAVERVLAAADHDALLRDPVDALPRACRRA